MAKPAAIWKNLTSKASAKLAETQRAWDEQRHMRLRELPVLLVVSWAKTVEAIKDFGARSDEAAAASQKLHSLHREFAKASRADNPSVRRVKVLKADYEEAQKAFQMNLPIEIGLEDEVPPRETIFGLIKNWMERLEAAIQSPALAEDVAEAAASARAATQKRERAEQLRREEAEKKSKQSAAEADATEEDLLVSLSLTEWAKRFSEHVLAQKKVNDRQEAILKAREQRQEKASKSVPAPMVSPKPNEPARQEQESPKPAGSSSGPSM